MSDVVALAKTAFRSLEPVFGVLDVTGASELSQEQVDALTVEVFEAKDALKTLKTAVEERTNEVKNTVFAVADKQVGEDTNFALYSPEAGLKLTREMRESGGGIDTDKLLHALYDTYGETYGDKTGKAWAWFKKITDEVEVPRFLNAGKLEAELTKAMSGMHKGDTIPIEAVNASRVPTTKTASFYARKMTKDEMEDAKTGKLRTGAYE